jgi:hypothetical protein
MAFRAEKQRKEPRDNSGVSAIKQQIISGIYATVSGSDQRYFCNEQRILLWSTNSGSCFGQRTADLALVMNKHIDALRYTGMPQFSSRYRRNMDCVYNMSRTGTKQSKDGEAPLTIPGEAAGKP